MMMGYAAVVRAHERIHLQALAAQLISKQPPATLRAIQSIDAEMTFRKKSRSLFQSSEEAHSLAVRENKL